jgi:hypothetical protein
MMDMNDNHYTEKYRRESIILDGNRNGSDLNQPLIPGNINNLKSHLLQLVGADKDSENPGHYLAPENKWIPGRIPWLREQLAELEKKFKDHALAELKIGNAKPKVWPDHLQEQKDRLDAKLLVAEEEQKELYRLIDAAQIQQKKAKPSLLTAPQHWGSSQLRDGQLIEIGPWSVSPNDEGLLCIDDEDSPYHTMPVWRFKSEILKPMGLEFALRHKQDETESLKLQKPRQKVMYPMPGSWNPKTDLIEYSGYSNNTIKKLKQTE